MYLVRRLILRSKVNIKEKFVLITGCDSGFGRETAIRLDEMGACVIATCLTKEGGQSLKSVTSDKVKIFQMDVTNSQQIKQVYQEVSQQIPDDTGKLDSNTRLSNSSNNQAQSRYILRLGCKVADHVIFYIAGIIYKYLHHHSINEYIDVCLLRIFMDFWTF